MSRILHAAMSRTFPPLLLIWLSVTLCLGSQSWPTGTQPEVWLKADGLHLTEGERVFSWEDSSGHGRHATHSPGVPTYREAQINGYPAVRFEDNMLKIPSFGNYQTLFLVYRMNRRDHWSDQAVLWHPLSDNDSAFAGGFVFGRFQDVTAGFPGAHQSNAYHPNAGIGFEIISAVAGANEPLVYADGEILQNLSTSASPTSSASNLILGIRSDGRGSASHIGTFAHFDIAELLFYKEALSESERQQVEEYLHTKYFGPPAPSFSDAVRDARPGDIINIPDISVNQLPHVPVDIHPAPESPRLIFSDMPEYFHTGDGIAMQEEVQPGKIRLYSYHVPTDGAGNKVISSVIENLGSEPLTLRFTRYAFPTPSGHYLLVGKQGLQQFFSETEIPGTRTLPPGDAMPVDVFMDQRQVWAPQLVHGFYEFEIDQPARISVLQRPPDMSNEQALANLPKLPRVLVGYNASGAGRGSFPDSNLNVESAPGTRIDTAQGNSRLVVADGNRDPWVVGWDSIDETYGENKGNYGIVYRIRLNRTSSDGRALAAFMYNLYPANDFCRHQSGAVQVSRGAHPSRLVNIPENQVTFSEPGDNVLLQVFPPLEPGREETIEIIYSPPGASCLPTPILFMPIDFPREEALTFDGWRHRAGFTEQELADPATSGWEANPGESGIPNSLRYAFGMDPAAPDRRNLPVAQIEHHPTVHHDHEYLTLTYRRLQEQWDIEYIIETSTDLETWTPAEVVTVSTAPASDGVETVTVRKAEPTVDSSRRFIRLRIRREG